MDESHVINQVKEDVCYVSQDFFKDMETAKYVVVWVLLYCKAQFMVVLSKLCRICYLESASGLAV